MTSATDIQHAATLLQAGKLVALPTETVYGLGASAFDADAVAGIFAAKQRPSFDPLIVHVAEAGDAWDLADLDSLPEASRDLPQKLADAFWPGPLTLVLPRRAQVTWRGKLRPGIPGIVSSGLDTVGLRVPSHPIARQLLQQACLPVAAPSANRFGGISPTRAEHVQVPCAMVLDGGPCATGVESTVVGFDGSGAVVLRLGGTETESIEALLDAPVRVAKPGQAIASPGMLDRHYAPRTPLTLLPPHADPASHLPAGRVGLIACHTPPTESRSFCTVEILSPRGDLIEAAASLFDAMHRLDAAGLDAILAQPAPEHGLGRAINDRLRRAAAK